MSRILIIDLTDKSIKEEAVPTGRYGRGLAMELIRRHSNEGCERLSPDNTFVVVPGLLTGCHVPCATRATVAARSDNGFAVTSITGDMPQKLAIIGIIVLRKLGKLFCFSDVMEQRCSDEKIPVEHRITGTVEITELCHTEGMLQKPAYKSMMNRLCR